MKPRIIITKNTLELDKMYVPKSIWEEIKDKKNITTAGNWKALKFNNRGNLLTKIENNRYNNTGKKIYLYVFSYKSIFQYRC